MPDIIATLRAKQNFTSSIGAIEAQVVNAEKKLGIKFANDYRECLISFGIMAYGGNELTGICDYPRLNVVNVTEYERKKNPTVPMDLYVIEQAHFDDIVIWQSNTGEVYQSAPNAPLVKICDSLCEYIDM